MSILRHTLVELSKDKEKEVTESRRQMTYHMHRIFNRLTADFLSETMEIQLYDIFEVLKEINSQSRILTPQNCLLKMKRN